MQRMVNGRWVELADREDQQWSGEEIRVAAQIPCDRALVLQNPNGRNQLLAPNRRAFIPEELGITDVPTHRRGRGLRASPLLLKHLRELSYVCRIDLPDDYSYIIIHDVHLPSGYNYSSISILVEIPPDYPMSPPGIGNNRIYLPKDLRFRSTKLEDLHESSSPCEGDEDWAWFCYEHIQWDPNYDDLATLLEMIRADLNNPKTQGGNHESFTLTPRRFFADQDLPAEAMLRRIYLHAFGEGKD